MKKSARTDGIPKRQPYAVNQTPLAEVSLACETKLIPDERLHTERYNTFRIVILCIDNHYYYNILLAQARPKMPCIYNNN